MLVSGGQHCNTSDNIWSCNCITLLSLVAYVILGTLHELSHLIAAQFLFLFFDRDGDLMNDDDTNGCSFQIPWQELIRMALQASLGRYSIIHLPISSGNTLLDDHDQSRTFTIEDHAWIIVHSGWICSLVLAIIFHGVYIHARKDTISSQNYQIKNHDTCLYSAVATLFRSPILPLLAYVTALEAISTDLLGFVPMHSKYYSGINSFHGNSHATQEGDSIKYWIICYCGNFGIILLNPSWLSIDGGRTALDVLEKMISVTMMRGAQSGGVVTFEPDHYSKLLPLKRESTTTSSTHISLPSLCGVRSRVVNSKRTDLSKRLRQKIVKDVCTPFGNLRGWNKSEYTVNVGGGRLTRAFFGHTRFATSSKATFEGTHPHQWSKRRVYDFYSFKPSSPKKKHSCSQRIMIGVENYVTHNGDFDFFKVNGKYYDIEVVQQWLEKVLGAPMPAIVDSAAIAGMIDLLRCQGCFALSARYALCLALSSSKIEVDPTVIYPTIDEYEDIASIFQSALEELLNGDSVEDNKSIEGISSNIDQRFLLSSIVLEKFAHRLATSAQSPHLSDADCLSTSKESSAKKSSSAMDTFCRFLSPTVEDTSLPSFVQATIDAFFDNDLLHSTRLFLEMAKGSFGLCVTSTIDAHRQVCLAARGQTMSVAFYPRKGLICYGSEQAAVKAGLNYENPGGNLAHGESAEADNAVRLDLDDWGGEICLIDWGSTDLAISPPNRNLTINRVMNNSVSLVLLHQSNVLKENCKITKRLTMLENNEFIKPLLDDSSDLVLADIRDIPKVCALIQDDWHEVGLNRMTAWNLAQCLRSRLKARVDGSFECHGGMVDILVTGCEVSLWVAEQFVSDLQKSFPKLFVKAVSSNKLLGLFGQELAMPCAGFPLSQKSMDLKDPIIIIVSHSGGTFAPLACSNLLQSFSSSIFAVTSEWDTQIGKQLRSMYSDDLLSSRIFSTECGVRPAEPCSVTVAATHQLLTNIFEHICITIIGDAHFIHISGSQITERDLQILERCNQDNIKAMEEIVGVDIKGCDIHERRSKTERELRAAGDDWAEHILEVAKAYIMSFIYIVVTVSSGYPLISGIAHASGLAYESNFYYFTRFLDSLIYFWLPQINITILRLLQKRNLRHRMVGRTVVVADCPWVAQAADAFLSKIFACSYSIASLNVLSGNPADHLVHRHTHRVVRGTLLVCGRPDGRLPALTSLEASTCLSVNQASSIQSLGGTCESITIGHNKSKLPLTHKAIYLKSHRPLFLSEKVLDDIDAHEDLVRQRARSVLDNTDRSKSRLSEIKRSASALMATSRSVDKSFFELSLSRSRKAKLPRSSASLLGAYVNLEKEARRKRSLDSGKTLEQRVSDLVESMVKENQGIENARRVFAQMDSTGSGKIDLKAFTKTYQKVDPTVSCSHLQHMFDEADIDEDGKLTFDEFLKISAMPNLLAELLVKNRDGRGLVQVQPSQEKYFGEDLRAHHAPGVGSMTMSQSQHFSMELYESRIASLQRFIAMTVMFHQMGLRVQTFFPRISLGLLGYRFDRTHSIMRVATTASPVSGADVRERMEELRLTLKIDRSVRSISRAWKTFASRKYHHKEVGKRD